MHGQQDGAVGLYSGDPNFNRISVRVITEMLEARRDAGSPRRHKQ